MGDAGIFDQANVNVLCHRTAQRFAVLFGRELTLRRRIDLRLVGLRVQAPCVRDQEGA